MRWLRRFLGEHDGPDPALRLPTPRQPDPPLFCTMPEEPWRDRQGDARLCGRIRSPYRPTCPRKSCVEAYAAALKEAGEEDARRRKREQRRAAAKAGEEGQVVAMPPRRASR